MRDRPLAVLAVVLAGLVLAGCQGSQPAGPPAPHGLDDVVRVLEEATFQVSGGEALAPEETGTASLQADDVQFQVTVHVDADAASATGDRRYGNLTFTGLDDGLQQDAAVISAIADGLSG